jgi:class 3 adenylate cyclase/predicted ATPase
MDFTALRTQVMALLQGEGRVAYRALKLQFQLDDDTLEALKDDLIYAKRLAVDEEGRVLVWTGGMSSAPPTASPVPLPATPDVSPAQGEAAAVGPATPDAERRQLTVMFCDLVDSTALSSQLDPEDYRDVVRAYQRVCTEVIQRYDGHIAQLLGDGLLVYFGYPQAHEDDAHRAVRTGLGILAAMGDLNTRLQQAKGIQLAVRVGIHTGLVVVGAMGGGARQEQLALGETPNIAARIQSLAQPNTVAISEATYRLVQGYFAYQDLGAQALRGVAEARHVYHVLGESGATSRLDVAQPRGLTPLVGREQEVGLLLERWAQVKAGHGQVVLLTGDAGIGKSRLVQMLKEHVAHEPHTRWECRSAEYSQNTALFPLVDLFQRILQFETGNTPDEKVGKLEQTLRQYRLPIEDTVPLFAPLLSLPVPENRYPLLNLSPQRQRQKTLETIVAILLELAERQPVLFILEDLHWTDPTTLELLNLVRDQTPTASLLVLLTCRPHFHPAWHHRSYITEMTLNHLSHAQVARIVAGMTDGKTFPAEVRQQIIAKTDGVPLFVEELTKAILESGHLKAVDDHYELTGSLSTLAIPATLQDSLMARLDHLVTAKAVAQYAAVIGRQFAYELLQAVSQLDDATLQRELARLVEAELVFQRGLPPQVTYIFKHALVVDAASQSLLKSTRQHYHQRIAHVLEELFHETAEAEPELLAHHYTEAGFIEQAIPYWQRAGQKAVERSAHVEAVSHFTKGLELLKTRPDTPECAQHELTLLIALGVPLQATEGWAAPRMGHAYARARELCQHVGDTTQLGSALIGLWMFYLARAEPRTACELGEQLLRLAHRAQEPTLLLEAHLALGNALVWLGEFASAHAHLEQGMALYNPQHHRSHVFLYGHDPGVWCRFFAAWALWHLGYPDQALTRSHEALTFVQGSSHPVILANAFGYTAMLHQLRREVQATEERAEAEMMLAHEHGIGFMLAEATFLRGWALAEQGQGEVGIAQMRQGLAAWQTLGAALFRPYYLVLLAEAYGKGGQPEEGLSVLAEALALVDQSGERRGAAELYRLQGVLLLAQSPRQTAEAEACFCHALDVARSQEAKSWELRTATSLARLWQQQGKRQEAQDLLAPVYNWFTEGFDTADLQDAKALLQELEDGR